MKEIIVKPVERGRVWLPIQYGQQETRFAYPPAQGTHQKCFKTINEDKELRPAEGLELALLTRGAYADKQKEWEKIRRNCFVNNYTRMPYRLLLIPPGHIEGDASLSGVLFEEDLAGKGLSTKMQIPDLPQWKQQEGIYHFPDAAALFVPSTAYEGKSFEHDGLAHTHLTQEGAQIFAKTAVDAGKTPYDWIAQRMKEIKVPEQRVSMLIESGGELYLYCDCWDGTRGDRAFGVFKSYASGSSKNA